MDRKSIIILVACFVLFVLWTVLVPKYYSSPRSSRTSNSPIATVSSPFSNSVSAGTNIESSAITTVSQAPVFMAATGVEELLEVTNKNVHYLFTSHGGGLKSIEILPDQPKGRNASKTNEIARLNAFAPVPSLSILGADGLQGDGIFRLTRTATGVRAEKDVTNGLRWIKEFQFSSNYLVNVKVRAENTSTQALVFPAQEWVVGTATPMGPDDNGLVVGVMWYDGASAHSEANRAWFDNTSMLGCLGLANRQPRTEYRAGSSNVVWVAVQNQFFALAVSPQNPAQQVVVRPISLPRPASWEEHARTRNAPPPRGFQAALAYPAEQLLGGKTVERQFWLFAGPKEYRVLERMNEVNNLELIMGFSGFFGFFAKALLLSMNTLHDIVGLGYGWIIILITFIIKLVFWPLTQASTRSMKRMQTLQPEMKALQARYKDDPAKLNKKMMEFMKENKVNPMGGCLPMAIQLPIFFGFYRMIQSAIELRGAQFLWVSDLSKPDTLFRILPNGPDVPFNLLPLIMGVTMLWQSRLTPPSPGMDPTQQKIMRYMPLMFLFILYNFSAGLTLYWTVQNLLTIAQMKLTKAQTPPAGPASPPKKKK